MEENVKEIVSGLENQTHILMSFFGKYCTVANLFKILGIFAVLIVYLIIYTFLKRMVKKIPVSKLNIHKKALIIRLLKYCFFAAILFYILGCLGIKLKAVWGAAGIAGIAISFAAQTTVSNFISGIFILSEQTIRPGDFITVGSISGTVDVVSLLSIRMHTKNGEMVRVPTSQIINSVVVNSTFDKYRRLTVDVGVSYDSDLQKALEALKTAPALCPAVLQNPAPAAWIDSFGDSSINLVLAVWFNHEDKTDAQNQTFIAIKKVFDEANIEIPFNQLVIKNA